MTNTVKNIQIYKVQHGVNGDLELAFGINLIDTLQIYGVKC